MVQHHIKYREIHGCDKVVLMEKGEHRRLHNRLRKEGKCNIPTNELNKISIAAKNRTVNAKSYQRNNIKIINFDEMVCTNIRHREQIRYNSLTGCITVSSGFLINKKERATKWQKV